MKVYEDNEMSVYQNSDNRFRAYIKETKKVISYPRVLMAKKLGRPLEEYEQVHHKDEDVTNNFDDNLSIELLGEHQSFHNRKYYDKFMICPYCGKEFLWTAKMQRDFSRNSKRSSRTGAGPFCSKHCSGSYSAK